MAEEQAQETNKETIRISKKTVYMVLGVILLLVIGFAMGWLINPNTTGAVVGKAISASEAGEQVVAFLNAKVGGGVSLVDVQDSGSLYRVVLAYRGQELSVFTTKNGEYFIQVAEKISAADGQAPEPSTQAEIPKSDKPVVEAFVFSYCPYGLQFQKALMPVYETLKESADITLVAIGAMHGEYEKQESLRQICIEEEYGKDKTWEYLNEFMGDTELGNCMGDAQCVEPFIEKIFTKLDIDKTTITSCMPAKGESIYQAQTSRARELGIGGSPTFVINGVKTQVSRTSEPIKQIICDAFNTPPEECGETLSSQSVSAGFGYGSGGSPSTGSC